MSLNKKSVDDINVKGKRVLVRCDFNVPLQDGKITDENRLVAALPTIKKLIADGGKVILCSQIVDKQFLSIFYLELLSLNLNNNVHCIFIFTFSLPGGVNRDTSF